MGWLSILKTIRDSFIMWNGLVGRHCTCRYGRSAQEVAVQGTKYPNQWKNPCSTVINNWDGWKVKHLRKPWRGLSKPMKRMNSKGSTFCCQADWKRCGWLVIGTEQHSYTNMKERNWLELTWTRSSVLAETKNCAREKETINSDAVSLQHENAIHHTWWRQHC